MPFSAERQYCCIVILRSITRCVRHFIIAKYATETPLAPSQPLDLIPFSNAGLSFLCIRYKGAWTRTASRYLCPKSEAT